MTRSGGVAVPSAEVGETPAKTAAAVAASTALRAERPTLLRSGRTRICLGPNWGNDVVYGEGGDDTLSYGLIFK
jgi:hypothetical protein